MSFTSRNLHIHVFRVKGYEDPSHFFPKAEKKTQVYDQISVEDVLWADRFLDRKTRFREIDGKSEMGLLKWKLISATC